MTATLVDNDIVVLEEHEFETCCDVEFLASGPCFRPARWIIRKACCGGIALFCDQCKEHEMVAEEAVQCRDCEKYHFPCRRMILTVEPLRRA